MKEIHSKYQKKNYEEITFNLDEYTCRKCDGIFTLDIDKCSLEYTPTKRGLIQFTFVLIVAAKTEL